MTDLVTRMQRLLGDAYVIEREMARGGMSHLFLATEVSLERRVVVKLLPPDETSEVSAARFRREIAVTAQLQHPNILPVLATGASEEMLYYVMPYVAGESLRHRMAREGALAIPDAWRMLHQVADALAYAHGRGIVHRDIKPENVLLEEGHAVLADFGVARAREHARTGPRLTQAGATIGTPLYMSPEQVTGQLDVDARADIYSLAVVGYEMLAGSPPFQGKSAEAVMVAQLTTTPRSLLEVRPDTPPQLADAIQKAMTKDPAGRYQSIADFRDALGTPASRISVTVRSPQWRAWTVGTAVMVLAALATLWVFVPDRAGDPRKSLIVFPFENRTGDPARDYLQEASMNLLGLAVSHWEDLRVFDDERTGSLLRRSHIASPADLDFDAARRMAREAKVGTMVLGDIRRLGDSLAVEAKVHDVRTGERLATEIVRAGADDDPRPLFDSLAARILSISGAPAGPRPALVAQTTRSLEAYREYLAGSTALQRYEIDSATARLQRAVALDSTFALAYIQLVNADGWAGLRADRAGRRALVAKAEAHSASLPLRLRTLVQYHTAYEGGNLPRARELAQDLIARDSTDVEAWYQLGEAEWHHGSMNFPHADTLGDLGRALHAFRTTLRLDSSYTLAYIHIMDALRACANAASILCVGDRAVYAPAESLARRYGDRAATLRARAEEQLVETAYEWVAAVPDAPEPRLRLLSTLVAGGRLEEAGRQIEVLRGTGEASAAAGWEARFAFRRRAYPEAAEAMIRAFQATTDSLRLRTNLRPGDDQFAPEAVLLAAGRLDEAIRLGRAILTFFPGDSIGGPSGILFPRAMLDRYGRTHLVADAGWSRERVRATMNALWSDVNRVYPRGAPRHRQVLTALGTTWLGGYLVTRDTTIVAEVLGRTDTTAWATWRVLGAHLALARGDTAAAREELQTVVREQSVVEFSGFHGVVRTFAWADLTAALGDRAGAARLYARLDSLAGTDDRPTYLVRSWAERGALYQALGDTAQAIEMYERFLTAWRDADSDFEPLLLRARDAVAALKGEERAGDQ